jgi:hypothetical protein
VVFGITRPLAGLVGVLQRMARGEIDAEIIHTAFETDCSASSRAWRSSAFRRSTRSSTKVRI